MMGKRMAATLEKYFTKKYLTFRAFLAFISTNFLVA
jgi:hypothetical protein